MKDTEILLSMFDMKSENITDFLEIHCDSLISRKIHYVDCIMTAKEFIS